MEPARELFGVPEGVLFGVDVLLLTPTRDFRDDERGVTLLLMNDLTGVERSSWDPVLVRGALGVLLRVVRAGCVLLAAAILGARRGVMGVLAVRVVASVGFKGRPLLAVVRSMGMVQCDSD